MTNQYCKLSHICLFITCFYKCIPHDVPLTLVAPYTHPQLEQKFIVVDSAIPIGVKVIEEITKLLFREPSAVVKETVREFTLRQSATAVVVV